MRKRINTSLLSGAIVLLLLMGCQTIESKDGSSVKDSFQKQDFALIRTGVSPELHEQAVKEGEKAKEELQQMKKDQSLSATAKRILAEAEEAREQGDEELYLAKVQEYRRILNDEPIKRAAESWVLEGRVLFSQLRLKEAQQALEEAVKLDSNNPEYLLTLADYLRWNGDYQAMEEVSLKAVSVIENEEPTDEELLSEAYSYLGLAYLNRGKYNLANNFLQQSLKIRKKLLGEQHPNVSASLNNLATLYRLQGRYDEAEPLYLQALDLRKRQLGENHPHFAQSLNNLAALYDSQGRYDEAEPLLIQALELDKRLLEEDHPHFAQSLNNLAALYDSQGRYDDAEPLLIQALELRKKQLGEDHPLVAQSLNNLAALYDSQGRYDDAEPLYLQALELRKRQLGEDHPLVAQSLNNLAALYDSQGRYDDAEPLYLQALKIAEKALGENHPNTNTVRANYEQLKKR